MVINMKDHDTTAKMYFLTSFLFSLLFLHKTCNKAFLKTMIYATMDVTPAESATRYEAEAKTFSFQDLLLRGAHL